MPDERLQLPSRWCLHRTTQRHEYRDRRLVHLADRPPIAYDLLSLDVGIASDLPDIAGYSDHAVSAKPLGRYAELIRVALPELTRVGVVMGPASAGLRAELAAAMQQRNLTLEDHILMPNPLVLIAPAGHKLAAKKRRWSSRLR